MSELEIERLFPRLTPQECLTLCKQAKDELQRHGFGTHPYGWLVDTQRNRTLRQVAAWLRQRADDDDTGSEWSEGNRDAAACLEAMLGEAG